MYVIPWKVHFLIDKKLGPPKDQNVQYEKDCIVLTMTWKSWITTKTLQLTFKDTGVEWNDRKDKTLRYSYGYEKMGSFNGYPVLTVDEHMTIAKNNKLWSEHVVHSVELLSSLAYEKMMTRDLTQVPEFKA